MGGVKEDGKIIELELRGNPGLMPLSCVRTIQQTLLRPQEGPGTG